MISDEKFYNEAVFQVSDTANFLWKQWEDAHILYDRRSGHTQVMNDFAREIFSILEDAPHNLSLLEKEIEKIMEEALSPDVKTKIRQTLIEFDRMGIIAPQ